MANVTDAAFRFLIAKYGGPDVIFTEFVSADGLASAGREKLLMDLWYSEMERPIVAQIFGAKPENFYKAAQLIADLKFDGIDINMGCPDRAVLRQGAGGALIKNQKLAEEIIQATKEGAPGLPISVKTRIGFARNEVEDWIPVLANAGLAAITVHLRTVKELSLVPAHWELMPRIVEIVNCLCEELKATKQSRLEEKRLLLPHQVWGRKDRIGRPVILGNGDIQTLTDAEEIATRTGADGVMIGRGIFGNPWLFVKNDGKYRNAELVSASQLRDPELNSGLRTSLASRLQIMVEHTEFFEDKFAGKKNFEIMKKHYKAYANGFEGAKELRIKLMEAKNAKDVEQTVQKFLLKEKILAD